MNIYKELFFFRAMDGSVCSGSYVLTVVGGGVLMHLVLSSLPGSTR